MRLLVLLALLSASILDQARASYVEIAASYQKCVLCTPSDAKRDSELLLLSPERLDNVGHGNSRPPCPPLGCTSATSKLCWDGVYDAVSWNPYFSDVVNSDPEQCTNYYTSGPRTGKVVSVRNTSRPSVPLQG